MLDVLSFHLYGVGNGQTNAPRPRVQSDSAVEPRSICNVPDHHRGQSGREALPNRRIRGDVVGVIETEVGSGEHLRGDVGIDDDRVDRDQ